MNKSGARGDYVYRLVLGKDGTGDPRFIEFEATGPHSALLVAARHCAGRKVEVLENGRSLGSIRSEAGGGYWVLTPPVPRASGRVDAAAPVPILQHA